MPTQFSFEEVASPNQMSNAAGTVFSTVAGILRFCKPMDRIRFYFKHIIISTGCVKSRSDNMYSMTARWENTAWDDICKNMF